MAKEKPTMIITPEFRLAFASIFETSQFDGKGAERYRITMLFPKNVDIKKLKELAKKAAFDKWGDDIPGNLRSPFCDGDDKPEWDGHVDHVYVRAISLYKPGIVDAQKEPIIDKESFASGDYARAQVHCYAYDKLGNKGVSFGFSNIQKLRDGERFAGGPSAEEAFDVVEGEEEKDNSKHYSSNFLD